MNRRQLWAAALLLASQACEGKASPGVRAAPVQARPPAPARPAFRGAGATLPLVLLERWIAEYGRSSRGATADGPSLSYEAVGSGEGVRRILSSEVDFAVSEVRLSASEIEAASATILEWPITVSGVAIAFNLPQVTSPLRLSPALLAAIYLGEVRRWDDRRLRELNPKVLLPAEPITVCSRTDASGSTAVFSRYLADVKEWREQVGVGKSLDFPTGLRALGSLRLAALVASRVGAIAYIPSAVAQRLGLQVAHLKNAVGAFVAPTPEAILAAVAAMTPPNHEPLFDLHDASSPQAYPLATYSFALVQAVQPSRARALSLARFLWWIMRDGQRVSPSVGFVPLPPAILEAAETELARMSSEGRRLIGEKDDVAARLGLSHAPAGN